MGASSDQLRHILWLSQQLTSLILACSCSSAKFPTSGARSIEALSGGPSGKETVWWTVPVASCLMATSENGEPFTSTVFGAVCALVLKAAAVSISKIALFSFRLPFFEGSRFVTGGMVP